MGLSICPHTHYLIWVCCRQLRLLCLHAKVGVRRKLPALPYHVLACLHGNNKTHIINNRSPGPGGPYLYVELLCVGCAIVLVSNACCACKLGEGVSWRRQWQLWHGEEGTQQWRRTSFVQKNTQPDQETLALNLYHTDPLSQELSLTYRIKGFSDLEFRNLDFRISDS